MIAAGEVMPRGRKGSTLSRLKRLLRLLALIDSADVLSAEQLARAINVSRRTVFRDLALLEQCGLPVRFEHGSRGYTLASPLTCRLKTDELACLLLAAQAVQLRAAPAFGRLIHQAIAKLSRILPEADRAALKQWTRMFERPIRPSPRRQEQHLLTILDAVRQGKPVNLEYETSLAGTRRVKVHASGLRTSDLQWELIGQLDGQQYFRAIPLERILSVEVDPNGAG